MRSTSGLGHEQSGWEIGVIELMRTNDPVLLSWAQARLAALDVPVLVFDTHASILEGAAVAIQRRIMIDQSDLVRAKQVLTEADEIARGDRDPLD